MKQIHIIWLLSVMLLASVVANIALTKANIQYFEEIYRTMAEQHILNSKVRSQIAKGDIEAAKGLLDREIKEKGALIAICVMEDCSSAAKDVMQVK